MTVTDVNANGTSFTIAAPKNSGELTVTVNGIVSLTDKNNNAHNQHKDVVEITAWGARVRTLVIETNEELMIARDTKEVVEDAEK